jgi:hypothetical protein
MDATANAAKSPARILLTLITIVFATISQACPAADSCCCRPVDDHSYSHWHFFDGSTWAAWSRTWHGPNSLATPLTDYYIPRTPACEFNDDVAVWENEQQIARDEYPHLLGAACDAAGDRTNCGLDGNYPCAEGGFERLGHIPNDLAIASPLAAGASGQAGR